MPKIDIVNAKNIIESNPEKAFFKLKNTGGPKGDTGAQGPQGPKGDTGPQGAPGASASVTVGSTTTLSPGADATVTNSGDTRNAILNFGIPTGAKGPKGDTGSKGDTGPMGPKGAKGDTGAAATVQVGNTNTGAPGTNAQVTNAGNEHFAVFNFTIPRGDKGATGATGAQGPQGPKGDTGAQGIQGPKGDTGSVKSNVVSELPETGEEDTFYLVNREATEQTATGKTINFTNSDNSGDITDFQLDGETSQNGTPTPSAPVAVNTTTGENTVKIRGKNLLKLTNGTYSSNGVTAVVNNGVVSLSGTATANAYVVLTARADYYSLTLNGSYKMTTQTTSGIYNVVYYGTSSTMFNASGPQVKALNGTYNNIRFQLYIPSGTNTNGITTSPMIVANGTDESFEPYQGQSYEVNLGKNLINFGSYQQSWDGAAVNGEGTTITMSPNASGSMGLLYDSTSFSVSIPTGRTIVWSRTWAGGGTWQSGTFTFPLTLTYSDGTTETLSFGDTTENNYTQVLSASKTLTKNLVSVKIEGGGCFGITSLSAPTSFNLQLELGSATSYAAYFTPIELCKIGDYQDYIYKSDGKWYVHKAVGKYQLDGTEVWGTATDGYILAANSQSPFYNILAIGTPSYESLCSHFYVQPNAQTWTGDGKCGFNPTGTFWVMYAAPADKNAFLAWLGQTKPSIYFPLATPTDTEITNQTLITQLDNVASAPLYTGVNNITTITPNEQGTLEIKYVTYDKYNQNKVYIWNDTLQQWQIIVP